jgi:hypothetical protein
MASWKKVIVSGSSADLTTLTLDTALAVAEGGIGATTLTDKAVLISQDSGTDAVGAVALTSNGQLIIGGADGPAAATLTGTSNEITVANGANSITLSLPDDVTIGQDLTITRDIVSMVDIDDMNDIVKSRNITNSGSVADSHITGSFTGSYTGDGSNLTGIALDIDGLSAGTALHQTQDHFVYSDNGTEKKITFSNVEDAVFGNVSGDATIAAGGALTIGAGAVEQSMIAAFGLLSGSAQISADISGSLSAAAVVGLGAGIISGSSSNSSLTTAIVGEGANIVSASVMVDHDAATNFVANEHIDHSAVSVVAGDGLTGGGTIAANRTLAVGAGTGITVNANDIAIGQAVATDSNVQFNNMVIDGNLTVNGTQTLNNTTNLLIEDRFILMNSGSSATGDGGILVGSGSAFSASAFIFDDSADRWGVQIDTQLGSSAASSIPEAYTSLYVLTANTGSATYNVKGNIKIDDGTGDIFIYS